MSTWRTSRLDRDREYRKINFSSDINDYEVQEPICGVDDMSYLYLAIHKPSGRKVAMKFTDLKISREMALLDELTTVAVNTMRYQHESLLPYFNTFVNDENLWSVTLPMKAGSCRNILDECFPNGFSETVVATMLKYILRGLDYLHDQGVIHNDIRAENVLVAFDGDVRLVGLHQVTNLAEARPAAFDYVGLPEWMAPELFEQQISFDPRSDIYSLGITAIELACGRTPYHEWPALKIMVAKLKYLPPIFESEINSGKRKPYSKHFFSFVRACLERDPNARPHAHELLKHPLLKSAQGASYLVKRLVKGTKLKDKFLDDKKKRGARTPTASPPKTPTKPSSPSTAAPGGSSAKLSSGAPPTAWGESANHLSRIASESSATNSASTSVCPSAISSSTALHLPSAAANGSRAGSPLSYLTASSISNVSEASSMASGSSIGGSASETRRPSLAPSHISRSSYLSTDPQEDLGEEEELEVQEL
ncbi:hypothetical protein H9P43_000456 [Blastocladiella emersonii ATCC 22665]|nr:hypothetical protein H9P43_000456 [Blastocladiella emersonii ATCC 22665]